MEYKCEEK